ncbi:MAG: YeaH/YhbH family protein [Gammaproteobacteria bacterium]|nr:MAG: YeaH/YhbH family protein [Gammaproteobacteria bacterium]
MSYIIDRRENSKNKSAVNRQRFLDRYKKHIKKAVSDAVDARSITDVERGEEVTIAGDDISEPVFQHGSGGRRTVVHPGNKEFVTGDRIQRPSGGSGGGGAGDASDSGEGDDDFVFQLTQDEFLEFLFDDLALPNLTKRHLKGNFSFKYEHAGFTNYGVPAKLSVLRSLKQAKARRIALCGNSRKLLAAAIEKLEEAEAKGDELGAFRLTDEIELLEKRIKRVPFLDTIDLRYKMHIKRPVPTSQAVMFCLMDVSGSMDQSIKDMAKRFYLLLYMFLKRHYEKTDIVFIRHHTVAKEVEEQEFFYSRETGGTVVSSALRLMTEIIDDRYSPNEWNIYGAQASDGDNWNDDSPTCSKLLREKLLPMVQYFAYVEITKRSHQALWREYDQLADEFPESFAQRHIQKVADIFPVFHDLFHKKDAA